MADKSAYRLGRQLIFVGMLAIAAVLIVTAGYATDLSQPVQKIDEQLLAGRWERADGGYILQLSEIKTDGSLKAEYFNPSPIHVFQAQWNRTEGKISLFVELRDVNYPGSKYNLSYDPISDSLKGTYFQAVAGETYEIEFFRIKQTS